ncbi:MAG TPA: heterodisulfide reductase-related iron-sulfur binding cluster [Candidatus Eisenbacteria bacterium]
MSVTPHLAQATARNWFDAEDAPAHVDLNTCIHCGLCLTACPTYRELKIEPDSPRGRLYLMRGLAEGRIEPSRELVHHLDQCLDCRACETVCPAGVPYGRLLEETRGQLGRRVPRLHPLRLLGQWMLKSVIPKPERMRLVADLLRLGQSGPLGALMRSEIGRRLLPRFAVQGFALTPSLDRRSERALDRVAAELPPGARMEQRADRLLFHPAQAPKAKAALFTTCLNEALFPRVNREAVRLLVLAGCEVAVPAAQTCCGALHAHAGLRREAKSLARENLRAFGDAEVIVTTSAGCGAALREVGHLLHQDPIAVEAARFGGRVRDVSEVLLGLGLPEPAEPLASAHDPSKPLKIGYHDPCHLAHAQRVRNEPRALLRRLPGVVTVDLPNSDWCCGSAGVYNLTHPEMAEAQLRDKLDSIEQVAPELVVASNPGCLLHMARGARERGMAARMVHLVEVLGRAYPPPPAGRAA